MKDIDLVVLWVDGNDPKWQQEKSRYIKQSNFNPAFYQDWNWMRYWFRCVEENMPWVRYVFFVTYGHTPAWLNLNHPKLKIINHKDYMPIEFLPTFSPIPINLNLHRIKELSETFIYAEDDIFFTGRLEPTDFFTEDGLPKDFLWLKPITEQFDLNDYSHMMLNNMLIIKKHYKMSDIKEEKLLSSNYPQEVLNDNNQYKKLNYIPGFKETHLAYSLLKSSFDELWEKENSSLFYSSLHKIRIVTDNTIALIRDWQLASGNFYPFYPEGRYTTHVYRKNVEQLILDKNTKILCINDSDEKEYTKERADEICSYFEKRFPKHSSFEID